MSSLTDRAGRWLVGHHHRRAAGGLAWLVMRPDARRCADVYVPLWIERWTVRDAGNVPGPCCARPGDVTAETGVIAMKRRIRR